MGTGPMKERQGASTCLSYWFPIIAAAGLPVPKTIIVRAMSDLTVWLDGKKPDCWDIFLSELIAASNSIGYPCFLRTGYGSGKHLWKDTCFVSNREVVGQHVFNLLEWSLMVDIIGLPTDVWVVREMLPVRPLAYLEKYGGMPLVREVRGFLHDGQLVCKHPYWPRQSIINGGGQISFYKPSSKLTMSEDDTVTKLFHQVGGAVPGSWSVDILDTDRGWYVIDMALAARSWHWPSCLVKDKVLEESE